MGNETEHLDHALAGEFQGHAETIHKLKTSNAHFHKLMVQNHELWVEIQNMQNNVTPADDSTIETAEKKRLAILDEIASMIKVEEA